MNNTTKSFQVDIMHKYVLPAIMSDRFLKGFLSEKVLNALRKGVENKDLQSITYNAKLLQIMVREY